jgi:Cu/Zn superoxide dismutase
VVFCNDVHPTSIVGTKSAGLYQFLQSKVSFDKLMSAIAVFQHDISGFVKFLNQEDATKLFAHENKEKKLIIDKGSIVVDIVLKGLRPGFHGIHIHEYGDLTATIDSKTGKISSCANVCRHYNPTHTLHGAFSLHGLDCHAGDLCNNVLADKHGLATFRFHYLPSYNKMFEIEDILGRSIVIHAEKDDLGQQRDIDPEGSGTTGNAGAKIACAVIGRMKPVL